MSGDATLGALGGERLEVEARNGADVVSPRDEARAFWRMRGRIVRTVLRQTLSRSRFRLFLVVLLSGTLWAGLFWLCLDAFQFLRASMLDPAPEIYDRTVAAIFSTFFATLLLMLFFSAGIILYGLLFRSREMELLLTLPARTERLFLHKFQEAVFLSSWGFVLLGTPMLLAYGVVGRAPWFYYALLLPLVVAFVYVPVALGGIACLLLMRYLPSRRRHVLALCGGLLVAGTGWVLWSTFSGPRGDLLTPAWFREILGRLQFAEGRLLPSWWLSAGLLETARGKWNEGILFLALVISNALLGRQAALALAARLYRPAYSALAGCGAAPRRAKGLWIDRALRRALGRLSPHSALLILKDLRLFRRDPVQWSQFAIFFGLLAFYFVNIHRLSYDVHYVGWVNVISFLNLSVVGLLMSTFTTRFVFPMISLEGQRFWLLGLLPVRRGTILRSKFFFAVGGSILPCASLILLSDSMLGVGPLVTASHQLTCLLLCSGLSGIAVGLGARLPNYREPSPARIAAGFGGTLNLVLSAAYIVAIVLLTAVPFHFYLAAHPYLPRAASLPAGQIDVWLKTWLLAGTAGSVGLGLAATAVPLHLGFRAFREMEF